MNNNRSQKIISIIQARMSSKRLPGKVLFPLGNTTILDQVIKKAKKFSRQVIVCTSKDQSDNEIESFCNKKKILCSRGELHNVFDRYQKVFSLKKIQNCDWFARVTADNPLISEKLANNLIREIKPGLDYISYTKNIPNGSGIELINKHTFMKIDSQSLDDIQREHVTPIFYENLDSYNALLLNPPEFYNLRSLRITIDYKEDYELVKQLFNFNKSISLEEVIGLFKKNHHIFELNKNCKQKNIR